jgi:site-specific recombinase XerD
VLSQDVRWLDGVVRAKAPARLPVVLSIDEVAKLLACMKGTHRLLGELLYGTGMRILEGLRLRVKDIDLPRGEVVVRSAIGSLRTCSKPAMTSALSRSSSATPMSARR